MNSHNKMTSEKTLTIDSLFPDRSKEAVKNSLIDSNPNLDIIEKKEQQKRLNLYHKMVHIIALIIIIPYIFLICATFFYNFDIPKEYSTLVSIVIGFYFGRSLFNNS